MVEVFGRAHIEAMPSKVLCAIDLGWEPGRQAPSPGGPLPVVGEAAEVALHAAARVAVVDAAELTVLHALHLDPGVPMSPEGVEDALVRRQQLVSEIIDAVLDATTRITGRSAGEVNVLVEGGPPDRAILDAADRLGSDFIVVGSGGAAKGLRRRLLGSTASAVARDARCSVLVARPALVRAP
jgi:nucleotide-binding universal stress UspA family protein